MKSRILAVSGAVVLSLIAAVSTTAHSAGIVVENYTATGTINVNMPGTIEEGTTVFSGNFTFSTLDFAPGSVQFSGVPIDFDGHEAQFMASTYSGQVRFPITSGADTVDVGVIVSIGGAVTATNAAGKKKDTATASEFSPNSFDVVSGQSNRGTGTIEQWKSTVIPGLNGYSVTEDATCSITSVDAANGIVGTSAVGQILADPHVPGIQPYGLVLLLIGLGGMGWTLLRARRSQGFAPSG